MRERDRGREGERGRRIEIEIGGLVADLTLAQSRILGRLQDS